MLTMLTSTGISQTCTLPELTPYNQRQSWSSSGASLTLLSCQPTSMVVSIWHSPTVYVSDYTLSDYTFSVCLSDYHTVYIYYIMHAYICTYIVQAPSSPTTPTMEYTVWDGKGQSTVALLMTSLSDTLLRPSLGLVLSIYR